MPGPKSWAALAALVFGQAYSVRDATTTAHELYGQALSEFRHGLSHFNGQFAKDGLASLTALYMYEMLACRIEKGWMLHADGLGWFLEWIGPRQQELFAGKSTLLEHRVLLIAKSIISGQSTFLCQSIWKTLPWEDDPPSKSAIDYLVDIGADIAGYVAQTKRHNNKSEDSELECSRLTRQVAASLQELNCWWQQWEANHTQLATEVALDEGDAEPLFPTLLEYDMPWTAFAVCTYNAMRILLLQLASTLQLTTCPGPAVYHGVILDIPNPTALFVIPISVTCTANNSDSLIISSDLALMPALTQPPVTLIRRDDLDDMREETEQSSGVFFHAPVIIVSVAVLSFALCFFLAWRRRRLQRQASYAHIAYATVKSPDGNLPRYPDRVHASRLSNDQMPPGYDASDHIGVPRHGHDASVQKQQYHGHKRESGIWGSLSSFGSSVGNESSLRR
ncbi:hypothetical protein S40285_10500 [Stachybotrys chlorohalonatus IBT 40285]|uniref:Ig-like domain-containing protein n=1 Tax=Stachybotrys chlorohalonatus (strain IBT 40285) TaxID=1283841 RepID=A0A084R119_STAC4|nr:hypothetical protein S40285_10500 [Stachybotrys chlorohalonata IBT 40285]